MEHSAQITPYAAALIQSTGLDISLLPPSEREQMLAIIELVAAVSLLPNTEHIIERCTRRLEASSALAAISRPSRFPRTGELEIEELELNAIAMHGLAFQPTVERSLAHALLAFTTLLAALANIHAARPALLAFQPHLPRLITAFRTP